MFGESPTKYKEEDYYVRTSDYYQVYVGAVIDCFNSSINIAVMEANKEKFESISKFLLSCVYSLHDNGFSTEFAEEVCDRLKFGSNLSFVLAFTQKVNLAVQVSDAQRQTFYNNLQSVYYDKVGLVDDVSLQRFRLGNSDTVFTESPIMLPLTILLHNFDKTELFSTYASKIIQQG